LEKLKKIEDSVERGAKLTRQLLGFARKDNYRLQKTDPAEAMEKAASIFQRAQRNIAVQKIFEKDGWTVEADRSRLEQVLINLFVNSAQAMPRGGELLLSTENVVVAGSEARNICRPPGRYVKMSIADTGKGIDEKVLGRIFDPFFSTRSIGCGKGLGLSCAYGIVRNHGGAIHASSTKGKGATFHIYLPAALPEHGKRAEKQAPSSTGAETVKNFSK
jgi:signal transduction histidine kinase